MNKHGTISDESTLAFFAPLLPWQVAAWQQFIEQHRGGQLPHGLLAAGLSGIGKRAFVWRMTAYLLCQQHADGAACGRCESCHWLTAGTHPDLLVLPSDAIPVDDQTDTDNIKTAKEQAKATPGTKDNPSIKIADIRALQDYVQTKGHGAKVIVLDNADSMTMGAANALLKTLEEPRDGVYLILVSDHPARLMPTIRSRVQMLPLTHIDHDAAMGYLMQGGLDKTQADHALRLTDGAVLHAASLAQAAWYHKRAVWLKTLLALQAGQRTPAQASDYWQGELSLVEFIKLSRLMLTDIWRIGLGLPSLHEDIGAAALLAKPMSVSPMMLEHLQATLDDVEISMQQNIQEKIAYDRLLVAMVTA